MSVTHYIIITHIQVGSRIHEDSHSINRGIILTQTNLGSQAGKHVVDVFILFSISSLSKR